MISVHLVMYQAAPDKVTTVLRTINGNRRLLPTVERDVFGFTHAGLEVSILANTLQDTESVDVVMARADVKVETLISI